MDVPKTSVDDEEDRNEKRGHTRWIDNGVGPAEINTETDEFSSMAFPPR